jgi:group I intron endonuclease
MEKRARGGKGYVECTAFYNAIKKYGWDNFTHEVLEKNLDYETACKKERFYISKFNTTNREHGYNLESGGVANCVVSEETKRRISNTLKGRKGTPHTEETKLKLRNARLGKKMPPKSAEYRKRLSESLKGRTFSAEHCKHISEGKKGTQAGAKNPRARKVLCVETGVVFDTIKDAGKFTGGSPKNIVSVCRGRLRTSGGYHWQYYD